MKKRILAVFTICLYVLLLIGCSDRKSFSYALNNREKVKLSFTPNKKYDVIASTDNSYLLDITSTDANGIIYALYLTEDYDTTVSTLKENGYQVFAENKKNNMNYIVYQDMSGLYNILISTTDLTTAFSIMCETEALAIQVINTMSIKEL